ncbi:MAG: carbamoyltransferase HypF [Woeseiaceae bacterium]|nr:carbamoyltransferase HypF [Woeseiaceae bacterium]
MAETADSVATNPTKTLQITLTGHVQGVGFRPFVYRLALEHELTGHVLNRLGEVDIVVQGPSDAVAAFSSDLIERAPPLARPEFTAVEELDKQQFDIFRIAPSEAEADAHVFVPPDYFMCDDCRRELADPTDRRYAYPFINCTQCGPRYTLIEALPYDRPNTSMSGFPLCEACDSEYRDPTDRRFHAEPVACPECGPSLTFVAPDADDVVGNAESIAAAISLLKHDGIVAAKGIGGYHLLCDAGSERAVATLRERKQRPDKPLAVMYPLRGEDGLDAVLKDVELNDDEAEMLAGPIRPIVLVRKRGTTELAANVAPKLADLGVFLPYSPLHQLLLDAFDGPLVATSGNISGEPVLTDNGEAERRLSAIADAFLHHDRPIVRPADDPVFRYVAGRMRPFREGRGSAPVELESPFRQAEPLLATGGHMKGALALAWDKRVVVSPHIGEMHTVRSIEVFERVAKDVQALYDVEARRIVCDAHPEYTTSRWARRQQGPEPQTVWHHDAHASALAAEMPDIDRWLVFAWDGVGLGPDDTLWGGEALLGHPGEWRRVGSWRPFHLPGGERAGREPWRSAAALHWENGLEWSDGSEDSDFVHAAWQKRINCPATSAVGRLFDAASAMVLGVHQTSFEAQGPMQLEALCRGASEPVLLPLIDDDDVLRTDWAPLLPMLADTDLEPRDRAERFHASMAAALVEQAKEFRRRHDVQSIGLTGGVFQNSVLAAAAVQLLRDEGFFVYLPERLPCNDAALCYGQAVEVAARNAVAYKDG